MSDDNQDIVKLAKALFERDASHWQPIYDSGRDDLHFLSDDPNAQWEKTDYEDRRATGRPALSIDQLSQFIHQVENDARMNTPSINVIPSDNEASVETAEYYQGKIKKIEYDSGADDVYDYGISCSIRSSIGYIRVANEYCDDDTFDTRLVIKRVINQFAVFPDCEFISPDGSDMKHCTVVDSITVKAFKEQYPDFDPICFETPDDKGRKEDDEIKIADFYRIVEEKREIVSSDSKRKRHVSKPVVEHYRLSGRDMLEKTTFPGKYVPVVPVCGEEAWVDGKRHLISLHRKAKDSQRMYNILRSLETEIIMKQPNAPVMAAEGSVDDYAQDWLNPAKAMVLRYRTTDAKGNALPAPQRLSPPMLPAGVVNAAAEKQDDIKAALGMYNASIGARSNETSGKAINARKLEGDVATFHFGDNLNKSIAQVGRILVSALPVVNDIPKIDRVIGMEDESKQIGINGELADGQEETVDLKKGKYDVRVITGSSFTTKRQEAAQFFADIVSRQPELMNVMGDLLFKNMDFAGAPAMAERMKKVIDPKFIDEKDREEDAPDPEKEQMKMVIQQGAQELQRLQQELESKQADTQLKQQDIASKAQSDNLKAEVEVLKMQSEARKIQSESEIKNKEMEIKEIELNLKHQELLLEQERLRVEIERARIDARVAMTPDERMMSPENPDQESPLVTMIGTIAQSITDGMMTVAAAQAEGNQALIQAVTKPKEVVRGQDGLIVGVV